MNAGGITENRWGDWVTTPPAFFKKDHPVDYQSKKSRQCK
jgi:hypothetical protein